MKLVIINGKYKFESELIKKNKFEAAYEDLISLLTLRIKNIETMEINTII